MTYDEAFAAAILGDRVRAVDMGAGVYIDYHFNGLRINFPSGSSSGYSAKPHDQSVEWEIVPLPEPVKDIGWGDYQPSPLVNPVAGIVDKVDRKRRRRSAWTPPPVIDDVGWGSKPLEPGPAKVEAWPSLAKPVKDSVSEGWAIFDKDKANE